MTFAEWVELAGKTIDAAGIVIIIGGALLATLSPALAQTISYDLKTTSVMRIKLPVSQAVTVTISDPVFKIVAADPLIADAQPITDKSLYLVGKAFGTTTVMVMERMKVCGCDGKGGA